ncbi:Dolichyl-phosphate beta-glucosyltransferase [Dirofilaria immitis]|nr:Dolichyl-phosphate beta-glucosyltransferase [Dirofilaria immitis]
MTEERLLLSTTSTIQNLTNEHMICLNSGRDILCNATKYCYHLLFTTIYGKFEQFGCDQPDNQRAAALAYIPPNDDYQQICILSGATKLCYCIASQCNEQWIVDIIQQEFNSSHMLYLLIGLIFIIVPWNVLLCYINRRYIKIILFSLSSFLPSGTLNEIQKCSLFLITLNIVISACLLISSWIPAIVTCESNSVERHIAELIFLPQIFRNTSLLSLLFIPFGFLPLLHIPTFAFCMIATKDDPLVSEELTKNAKSLQQESNVSTGTVHSAPLRLKHNTIELSPEPFVVNTSSNGILNLKNTYCNDWAAIRILTNNSELNIHPTKFLLPPGRTSAAEITMRNNLINGKSSSRLLIQWYILGAYCPARNVNTLWTRPYYTFPHTLPHKIHSELFSIDSQSFINLHEKPVFVYTPANPGTEEFRSLFTYDDDSSGELHCTKPDLYLSVIIPAMNEQERLPIMLNECLPYLEERQAEDSSFTYEIIVVDDGSTDGTADTGYQYMEKYKGKVRVLKLKKNLGKGGAVRRGVLCARGSLIMFADADGATKFADFQYLEEHLLDLIALNATRSLARTFLMIGFHVIVYIFTVRTVRDTQCGFKLFTRGAVSKLFPLLHIERWAFDVELLFLAEQFNIPIREVPVTWHEVDGSKIVPVISWIQMGRDLMLIWFRYTTGIWDCNLL